LQDPQNFTQISIFGSKLHAPSGKPANVSREDERVIADAIESVCPKFEFVRMSERGELSEQFYPKVWRTSACQMFSEGERKKNRFFCPIR
jgi:hypothetical protein